MGNGPEMCVRCEWPLHDGSCAEEERRQIVQWMRKYTKEIRRKWPDGKVWPVLEVVTDTIENGEWK